MEQISNLGPKGVRIVLVGNKIDLIEEREVSYEEGQKVAQNFGIPFYECSAKTGNSIEEVFYKIGQEIVENSEFSKTESSSQSQLQCSLKRYSEWFKKKEKLL